MLSECLDSLRQQVFQHFSVILVDNGSNDGSINFVNRHYPEVKTIALPKNLGFAAANNIAIKSVNTGYVALLNNDAVPHPLWLQSLIEALGSHPEAGFAASKMLFYDNPETIDRAGDAYTRAGTGLLHGRGESASNYNNQEWIFGACAGAALYRIVMLNDVGLFDEDFFLLYEDVDLSFRAQLKGYKCLYVPEAIVYHRASSSIVYDSPISVYYSHRNLEWVYLKNMPPKLILKTIWLHIIYGIAAFIFFSANGRIKEVVKAKRDALKGLKGILKKRRHIQRNKKVDDNYIWGLLEKELFFPRLTRRLRKN
ncbi:MAG: glycosyltransferase family 2 protein [Deltaproteobacteria bacterium]|nr:glycosyltransferase family 2 protein [Deltaproteobacteria bacterium]